MSMEKVTYQSDWNGGRYNIDLKLVKKVFLKDGTELSFKHTIRSGEDYDHGHTYRWEKPELLINLGTLHGYEVEIPLMELIERIDVYVVID